MSSMRPEPVPTFDALPCGKVETSVASPSSSSTTSAAKAKTSAERQHCAATATDHGGKTVVESAQGLLLAPDDSIDEPHPRMRKAKRMSGTKRVKQKSTPVDIQYPDFDAGAGDPCVGESTTASEVVQSKLRKVKKKTKVVRESISQDAGFDDPYACLDDPYVGPAAEAPSVTPEGGDTGKLPTKSVETKEGKLKEARVDKVLPNQGGHRKHDEDGVFKLKEQRREAWEKKKKLFRESTSQDARFQDPYACPDDPYVCPAAEAPSVTPEGGDTGKLPAEFVEAKDGKLKEARVDKVLPDQGGHRKHDKDGVFKSKEQRREAWEAFPGDSDGEEETIIVEPLVDETRDPGKRDKPETFNRAGARVFFGTSPHSHRFYYCGHFFHSDGARGAKCRCGPCDGPQCPDCAALHEDLAGLASGDIASKRAGIVEAPFRHVPPPVVGSILASSARDGPGDSPSSRMARDLLTATCDGTGRTPRAPRKRASQSASAARPPRSPKPAADCSLARDSSGWAPGTIPKRPIVPASPASSSISPAKPGSHARVASCPRPAVPEDDSGFGFLSDAFGGFLSKAMKFPGKVEKMAVIDAPDWLFGTLDGVANAGADVKAKLVREFDSTVDGGDTGRVNFLLDSAIGAALVGPSAPNVIARAANKNASRQLSEALSSDDPQCLKGAMVAAQRLNATEVPEFALAVQRYHVLKKFPENWDVSKMVLGRTGGKIIAKTRITDSARLRHLQDLLDATHRKVYTRDRRGGSVPDRLVLVEATEVANGELWIDYMARQEGIRREIRKDRSNFFRVTAITSTGEIQDGVSRAPVFAGTPVLEDLQPPLDPAVNEVLMSHGTSPIAADKISTDNFKMNFAGSNAGTLYGRGVYLAENASKSDEYAAPDPATGNRTLLICRSTLGRVFYDDKKQPDPRECEDNCLRGPFHSVLGDRRKIRDTFREFVIFDQEQVYANYIITYRRYVKGKLGTE